PFGVLRAGAVAGQPAGWLAEAASDGLPDGASLLPPEGAPDSGASGDGSSVFCGASGAAGTLLGPQSVKKASAGTTNAWRDTSPVLLKVKVTFCALPSWTASRLLGRTAEALSAPPRISEPPAGTVRLPPSAGVSFAVLPVPGR